ncbi:MAG: HAD family phosphatase [Candidatus Aenigmarchaeota archaeon]|nr:HAD family phosphatase [Candidatus Aenigmarchaeota archaeon]
MPIPIKLISLDIDGTLYEPKGSVVDLKKLAEFSLLLKKLRSKGVTTVLCTGKTPDYVEAFSEAYGFVGGKNTAHVTENGGIIFVYDSWKEHRYINLAELYASKGADIKKVGLSITKATGADLENKTSTITVIPPENAAVTDEFYSRVKSIITNLGYSVLTIEKIQALSEASKILLASPEDKIKPEVHKIGYDFFVECSALGTNITPFPICKGFGLAYVSRMHNAGLENVLSIADNSGDCTVFDLVGVPVAVANATPDTKEFVKKRGFVTKRKALDGVIDAMKLLLSANTKEKIIRKGKDVFV